jgi:EAL domain-containing protein (putative c-di-GMP-specific phosphodiesterase class I)
VSVDVATTVDSSVIRRVVAKREVRVVYQPVVDLKTQKTFAYEALVRSTAPEFSNPMELFAAAVAEECTGELGRLIRELALEGCNTHPLFLNVHPAELNEKWVVQPNDPIFQHDHDVYLEITEGVPLSHFRLCQSILREVRGRGVYLVVDDLGAGYSNLRYIADLHPRVVKLDRELVKGLVKDTRMFKLVSGIVVLCKDLDALVVAEGIETAEELEAVRDAGAQYGQGYVLARPSFPPPSAVWPLAPKRNTKPPVARRTGGFGNKKKTR